MRDLRYGMEEIADKVGACALAADDAQLVAGCVAGRQLQLHAWTDVVSPIDEREHPGLLERAHVGRVGDALLVRLGGRPVRVLGSCGKGRAANITGPADRVRPTVRRHARWTR